VNSLRQFALKFKNRKGPALSLKEYGA